MLLCDDGGRCCTDPQCLMSREFHRTICVIYAYLAARDLTETAAFLDDVCEHVSRIGCICDFAVDHVKIPNPPPLVRSTPAPRLVGIEPNPGPQKKNPLSVAAIATAVAAALKNMPQPKKKKKKNGRPQNGARGHMDLGSSSSVVSAPAARQVISRGPRQTNLSVPFKTTNLSLNQQGVTTFLYWVNLTTAATYISGTSRAAFPLALFFQKDGLDVLLGMGSQAVKSLFQAFARYKVRNLKIHYEPVRPTSEPGSVAFCFTSAPCATSSTSSGYSAVASASQSMRGPVWQSLTLAVPDRYVNPDQVWKICDCDLTGSIVADDQLTDTTFGTIVAAASGTTAFAGDTSLGNFTFEGVFDLQELANHALT